MSYAKVLHALNDRLETVVGLPPVQFENETPLKNDIRHTWCRGTLLPAETDISTLGQNGYNEMTGLYQVDIFYPIGDGPFDANDMADDIIAVFPKTLTLTYLSLKVYIMMSWREPASKLDGHYMIPIIVRWRAFV